MASDNRCTDWFNGIPTWLGGNGHEWISCCVAHDRFYETHNGLLEFIGAHWTLAKCVAGTGHIVMAAIMFVGLCSFGMAYLVYLKATKQVGEGMINRTTFFAMVRQAPFGGKLMTAQIDGMNFLLNAWEASPYTDLRWLAYMLATVFWETSRSMQPIREANGSSDAQTIARLDAAWKAGRMPQVKAPYWRDGWFGRGYVQITHRDAYAAMTKLIGVDLVANPDKALDPDIAAKIMFEGMLRGVSKRGDFTGKSLEDFFNNTTEDPENARMVINGHDKAKLIAGFYKNFLDSLKASVIVVPQPVPPSVAPADHKPPVIAAPATPAPTPADIKPKDAEPDDVPVAQSKSLWAMIVAAVTGGGFSLSDVTGIFGSITNVYAAVAFVALAVVLGILVFLMATGRLQILKGDKT